MSAFWDKIKKKDEKDDVKTDANVSAVAKEKTEKKPQKEVKKDEGKKKDEASKPKKVEKKAKKKVMSQVEAKVANKVLVSPKVSESSMNQQAIGKYVFQVAKGSSKREIAQAVEAFYGVNVEKVNVLNYPAKTRNFRGVAGTKKGYRKAIATIKKGESIDMFKESK